MSLSEPVSLAAEGGASNQLLRTAKTEYLLGKMITLDSPPGTANTPWREPNEWDRQTDAVPSEPGRDSFDAQDYAV